MKLLAFDTSTAQGSVAVLEGGRLLAERIWRRAQSHSEFLTAEIESALQEASLRATDLDALAVGQGPGSFTGIRVAINAAKALGYALSKKVYVANTADILVQPIARFDLPVLTIINAQKNSYFVARYERQTSWHCSLDLAFMPLQKLDSILSSAHLCVGDACLDLEPALSPVAKTNFKRDTSISDYPLASNLARLTMGSPEKAQPSDWNAVQPLYIRASGAEEKIREGT
jgi:tRNA threonylcarbamoyladenosine biosynthesis protein TsaB